MDPIAQEATFVQEVRRSERLRPREERGLSATVKVFRISRSQHVSAPRTAKRSSLLRLPPEIRNRIMHYILVPGDIYIPGHSHKIITKARRNLRAKDRIEAVAKKIQYPYLSKILSMRQGQRDSDIKYGFQVLATCKQLYCEGYAMFYCLNVFHLPPGPLCASTTYFDNLQPHHKSLIKHIAIDFSIADMTPRLVSDIFTKVSGRRLTMAAPSGDVRTFCRHLSPMFFAMWHGKLKWLGSWSDLLDVKIQHHVPYPGMDLQAPTIRSIIIEELVVEREQLNKTLSISEFVRDKQLSKLIWSTLHSIANAAVLRVSNNGWEGLAEWLTALELGPALCVQSEKWRLVCPGFAPLTMSY